MQQDTSDTTWIEPCGHGLGNHAAYLAARGWDAYVAHLATVYRFERKGRKQVAP